MISTAIGLPIAADTAGVQAHINGEASSKDLTAEYKEKKKLAKRIIKAVQGSLEDAMRRESEVCQKPFEKELRELDLLLENSLLSRHDSLTGSVVGDVSDIEVEENRVSQPKDTSRESRGDSEMYPDEEPVAGDTEEGKHDSYSTREIESVSAILDSTLENPKETEPGPTQESCIELVLTNHSAAHQHPTPEDSNTTPPILNGEIAHNPKPNGLPHDSASAQASGAIQHAEPPTPPLSSGGDLQPLSNGGIPWYMDPFDPEGTTIQEERWTGRELVRGMSEELSDMDEEELLGLVDGDMTDNAQGLGAATLNTDVARVAASRRKAVAKRRRWRGYR